MMTERSTHFLPNPKETSRAPRSEGLGTNPFVGATHFAEQRGHLLGDQVTQVGPAVARQSRVRGADVNLARDEALVERVQEHAVRLRSANKQINKQTDQQGPQASP